MAIDYGCLDCLIDPCGCNEDHSEIEIHYCYGEDGRSYYAKGHVDISMFKAALLREVDSDDDILSKETSHCWMRTCRDFQNDYPILTEAKPGSRGAFRVTWVQDA